MTKRNVVEELLHSMSNDMKDTEHRTCYKEGCERVNLIAGHPGGDKISCNKHQHGIEGLQKQTSKCVFKGCDTKGTTVVANTRYRFCAQHRDLLVERGIARDTFNDIKTYARKCVSEGCEKTATHDDKTRCALHSPTGRSDDKRRCNHEGCTSNKRPTFGFGANRTRCKDHREEGMASHKTCAHDGCALSASYGEKAGVDQYCKKHRPGGFVLNARTCASETCTRQPCYGPEGGGTYTHCALHKPDGYVDTRNKRCVEDGCTKNRSFGVKGGERLWCLEHKTDECINLVKTTCAMACCLHSEGCQATFFHPEYTDIASDFFRKRICYFARRALIEDAIMANDMQGVGRLLHHFKLDKVVTLNAQSAFRFACEKRYYTHLESCVQIIFDQPIKRGAKSLGDKRPDIFYKWCVDDKYFGIHVEYDEHTTHEDEDGRLRWIAREAGCDGTVYVIRVNGGRGMKDAVCSRVRMPSFEYYKITPSGKAVAAWVADAVVQRIRWIRAGLHPDDDANRPYKVYF